MKLIRDTSGGYVNAEYMEHFCIVEDEDHVSVCAHSTNDMIETDSGKIFGSIVEYELYRIDCTEETRAGVMEECRRWLDGLVEELTD